MHEDTALRIDVENFEGSRVEGSRVCVDRWGKVEWADSHRGQEDVALVLVVVQPKWALR